jgi:succinate dehydrogenase / fumarate reductase cytochrome b subunit
MTAAQIAFTCGFLLVIALVFGVVLIVFQRARTADGGGTMPVRALMGLGRLPTERNEGNRWASYLHRLTGIGVLLFLCLHILDVSLFVVSETVYDQVHVLYGSTVMRLFECGLLFALLFHALNGVRLIAIDVWDLGMKGALRLLTIVTSLTVALTLAGSIVIMLPVFM